MNRPLVIGSRGSALARWQAQWVQDRLRGLGQQTQIRIIQTSGDRVQDRVLAESGGKGLFTKEIEDALLASDIDLAVHSLKDMPAGLPPGLALTATPVREDPRDALVGSTLEKIPPEARVGTSSLRRAAQLLWLRPDLDVQMIRGNVDTRLRKLDEGQFAVIVLASAGLKRLGWENRITELLEPDMMCPAAGQGALAVETREDGGHAFRTVSELDEPQTRACITAERAVVAALGGSCQAPIGAYARVEKTAGSNPQLRVQAVVASPDGSTLIRRTCSGPFSDAERIGRDLGNNLLLAGAREILDAICARPGS